MAEQATPGSFIPHDTVVTPRARREGGGLNDLLLLLGIVLFVASAALGVAVFLYQQFLQTESTSKVAQLERAKSSFEPSLIQQLTRLDDRMHSADAILGTHIAPSGLFRALEQATLKTVAFQTLDFEAADAQRIAVKMQGIAASVNSIALQADLFSKNGVISSPIFSNIARQFDGVHFNLAAVVNPSAINYASAAAASTQAAQGELMPTIPTAPEAPASPFDGAPADTSGGQGPQSQAQPQSQTQSQ
jgi:hypothetical protein